MKAIVYDRYGSHDVLKLEEVQKPTPNDGEVLIKVHAASVNSWDWDLLRGRPLLARLGSGLLKPRRFKILGCDIAGRVDSVGSNAKLFQPGDEVFGDISGCSWGGFAEYVCASENALSPKPASMGNRPMDSNNHPMTLPCWRQTTTAPTVAVATSAATKVKSDMLSAAVKS